MLMLYNKEEDFRILKDEMLINNNATDPDLIYMTCRCNHKSNSIYRRKGNDFLHFVLLFILITSYTHTFCSANSSRRRPSANWAIDGRESDSRLKEYKDLSCKGDYLSGYSLSGGTKAGKYVNIGTVGNIIDCSNLCCQQDNCKLAIMLFYPKSNKTSCFKVRCYDEYNSNGCTPVISEKSRFHPYIFKRHNKPNRDKLVHHSRSEKDKGVCRPYSGSVCAKNIDKSKHYYYSTHNATILDKRLRGPIKQLSSRLTGKCCRLALQAICYRFYPQCLDATNPKPISICNDYCNKLIYGDCGTEFRVANMVSYLKRVIPGCNTTQASITSTIKCIQLPDVAIFDRDETEKFMHERSEQSSDTDSSLDKINEVDDAPSNSSSSDDVKGLDPNITLRTTQPTSATTVTYFKTIPAATTIAPNTGPSVTSKRVVPTTHTNPTERVKLTTSTVPQTDVSNPTERVKPTTTTVIKPTTISLSNVKKKEVPLPNIVDIKAVETDLKVLDSVTDGVSSIPTDTGEEELRVSAGDNTEITLPENNVSLFASTWQVDKKRHGIGYVNVTVKDPSHVNHPPRAEITQKEHVIQLPTNTVILDASTSTDDDKIVSYKWEELKGPTKKKTVFGSSTDSKILELKNLVAGVYKFRLTVTDSNGETDKTEASVTVKKEADYPPKANAGNDVIIRLPNNTIILNGNKSTDDKDVLKYQWSKTSDSLPCDMNGTDKSQLKLSRLQKGTYVFVLKVTDSNEQSSEARVKVVVLPETNIAPVAVAGDDKEIIFPDDSTTLDASKSTDNSKFIYFHWEQVSGPGKATLTGTDNKKVKLSDLVIGTYVFKLTVSDEKNLVGTDTVRVHVKKDHNEYPIAAAGKGRVIYLPTRSVVLDGSSSHDDETIDLYLWTRAGLSPAAGIVLNGSDHKAILRLTNLVRGRYVFDLTVTDNKGLTGTDSVTVLVQEDPNRLGLVELVLYLDINNFSEENKKQLVRKISVILEVGKEFVVVEDITGSMYETGVFILFYVKDPNMNRILDGKYVADMIKQKVGFGGKLFEYRMQRVEPYICRNNCSEHGYCDKSTKQCICDSFWTANFFKSKFGEKETNCDWSILYLSVAVFGLFLLFIGVAWSVCFCFARKNRNKRRARYRALITNDPDTKEGILLIPKVMKAKFSANSLTFTESDDDSDQETTVFDKKKLVNGHVRMNGSVKGNVTNYHDRNL